MKASAVLYYIHHLEDRHPDMLNETTIARDAILAMCPAAKRQPSPGSVNFGMTAKDDSAELSARDIALALVNAAHNG